MVRRYSGRYWVDLTATAGDWVIKNRVKAHPITTIDSGTFGLDVGHMVIIWMTLSQCFYIVEPGWGSMGEK